MKTLQQMIDETPITLTDKVFYYSQYRSIGTLELNWLIPVYGKKNKRSTWLILPTEQKNPAKSYLGGLLDMHNSPLDVWHYWKHDHYKELMWKQYEKIWDKWYK